jgi:hypothetical protein
VHEQDNPRAPLSLELRNLSHPHRVQHALPDDRLQRRQHEKNPKDVEHAHEILLVVIIRLSQSPKEHAVVVILAALISVIIVAAVWKLAVKGVSA